MYVYACVCAYMCVCIYVCVSGVFVCMLENHSCSYIQRETGREDPSLSLLCYDERDEHAWSVKQSAEL